MRVKYANRVAARKVWVYYKAFKTIHGVTKGKLTHVKKKFWNFLINKHSMRALEHRRIKAEVPEAIYY